MQNEINIPTPDNHLIPCTLNYEKTDPNKVILFVHGFTGNQHEHQYYNAVKYFTVRGFATFRFDFYTIIDGVRKLSESLIDSHIRDLQKVIKYLHSKYQE